MHFFAANDILYAPNEQFAYRANYSCEDALILATERWRRSLDHDEHCGIVFADMTKAFDRVLHQELLNELFSLGLRGTVLKWFADYLSNRQQTVVINNVAGEQRPCSRGVPQGSVLGPLLFCIYIRTAPTCSKFSISQLFADDLTFYVSSTDSRSICVQLTSDLENLDRYLQSKGLLLNPTKTKFILLRRPNRPMPDNMSLTCRGVHIEPCSSTKYLGIIIDEHLTFKDQVNHVCTVAHQKVAAFRHNRRNLNKTARRLFYLSIVQSTLEYASSSYIHSLSQSLYNKLLTASTISIKKIFSLDRRTSNRIAHVYADLYTLEQRLNLKTYVFVYRCLHGLASPLLQSLFVPIAAADHTNAVTRGQSASALTLPRSRTRYGYNSVSFLGADRWNSLPSNCRQARSPAEFASRTKLYLGFPVRRRNSL